MKSGTISIAVIAFLGLGLLVIVALMLTAPVHASQAAGSGEVRLDVRESNAHVVQTGVEDVTAQRPTSP